MKSFLFKENLYIQTPTKASIIDYLEEKYCKFKISDIESFSTDKDGNDGVDPNIEIPMGIPSLITLVFNKNTFTFYVNGNAVKTLSYGSIYPRNIDTKLYIGDHFDGYGNDGNVLIKNFTIYDGALNETDVK